MSRSSITIEQPFPSLVVVTVRPLASVIEDTARAVLLEPLDENEEEDDEEACTEGRPWPVPDRTLTELAAPEGCELVETAIPFGTTPFT